MASRKPVKKKSNGNRRPSAREQQAPGVIRREVAGIALVMLGVLTVMYMISRPETGMGAVICYSVKGLAGSLGFLVPILCLYFGGVLMFSGRNPHIPAGYILPTLLLALSVFGLAELGSMPLLEEKMMANASRRLYVLAFKYGFQMQTGGGAFGIATAWPLYEVLGFGKAGSIIVYIGLILIALVLIGKLSPRRIGESARPLLAGAQESINRRVDDMNESYRRRREEREEELRRRAEEEENNDGGFVIPSAASTSAPKRSAAKTRTIADDLFTPKKAPADTPSALREELAGKRAGHRNSAASFIDTLRKKPEPQPAGYDPYADDEPAAVPEPVVKPAAKAASPAPLVGAKPGSFAAVKAEEPAAEETQPVPRADTGSVLFEGYNDDDAPAVDLPGSVPDEDTDAGEPVPDIPDAETYVAEPAAEEPQEEQPYVPGSRLVMQGYEPRRKPAEPLASFSQEKTLSAPIPHEITPSDSAAGEESAAAPDDVPFHIPAASKPAPVPAPAAAPVPYEPVPYNYPPIDLLAKSSPADLSNQKAVDLERGRKLVEVLLSFGITTELTGVAHGPTVTRFELAPAAGVKVSRITNLVDDIALGLAAKSVRIEAPIPGKPAVGVEVPNDVPETVPLRDVLESPEARNHPSRVAVAIGRDNAGRNVLCDIAKMPHILIAGATGSGKSVCINCVICSILYRATPEEVKMVMIDPKMVELSAYNGIPHLLAPVVTDPKKAASALEWVVTEMTARYKKFAALGVRDLKAFNARRPVEEPPMPQIVVIIDELADLMMLTPTEVEDAICRIAQLARACGIHLVIATQRPSVDVITGLIKANIPSRIAFTVASFTDSRTILDTGGAEKLLMKGDMLYAPSGANKPQRVQGAWVDDNEVHEIVSYITARHDESYSEDLQEHMERSTMSDAEKEDADEQKDELLEQAIEFAVEAGQCSISMLQRKLRIGYARAGRMIDEMTRRGIVSEQDGAKPRDTLITREQYRNMKS